MTSNLKIKLILAVLLSSCILLSNGLSYGLVLCIGNEEHFAIESTHETSIIAPDLSETDHRLAVTQEKNVHNDCLDIPILFNSSKDHDFTSQRTVPQLKTVFSDALSEATLTVIQKINKPLKTSPLFSSIFLPLKTIVLII